ncbi:MAG: exonuclease domain-containing protein [Lachnospiraceae bacterium]|nr:exonuclease domain-containing protein [Lachnospiraceae bacterium]
MIHVVIDLEMNIIKKQVNEDGHKLSSEVIEIGAVKTDDNFNIIDKFQTYVSPDFGPLTPRIIKLTHITDETLEGAPKYAEALRSFLDWVGDEETTFYSWSLADIRQFINESRYKGAYLYEVEDLKPHWVDFQKVFSDLLGIDKIIKLKDAVSSADYQFTGAEHTALADAVNTTEIFILSKDPEKFEKVMGPVLDLFREDDKKNTLFDMCPDYFNKFNINNSETDS